MASQILANAATINGATPLALDANDAATAAGTIDFLGDDDLYSFVAAASGSYTLRLTPTSGGLQTHIYVYGGSVVTDSHGKPTLPLVSDGTGDLKVNVTAGSTYYVMAAGNGQSAGNYVLNTFYATWNGLQDPALIALVQQLFTRDGMLTRNDMIQVLQSTVNNAGGTLSTIDFNDLRTLVRQDAAYFKMPDYVRVLSKDVVLGNTANAYYTGGANYDFTMTYPPALGDLQAGSSALQMNDLIGKWFLGTDMPDAEIPGGVDNNGLNVPAVQPLYAACNGALFGSVNGTPTPVLTDAQQGAMGDCYFIATMVEIANVNPTAVKNMFLDNGDGTWTIRFYNGGTTDYVTVNNQLPVTPKGFGAPWKDGGLLYNGAWTIANPLSTSNVLWLALLEKAYAQWNEVGMEGHGLGYDGINAYQPISGGFSKPVFDQVLGPNDNSVEYFPTGASGISTTAAAVISALNSGKAVTLGTVPEGAQQAFWTTDLLLYESHMYSVVSYDPTKKTFLLHNPWGSCPPETGGPPTQPRGMTWAELNADSDYLCIADASKSVPFLTGASTTTSAVKTGTAPSTTRSNLLFFTTANTAMADPHAGAVAAWFAIGASHADSQSDKTRTAAHDLALLDYLA